MLLQKPRPSPPPASLFPLLLSMLEHDILRLEQLTSSAKFLFRSIPLETTLHLRLDRGRQKLEATVSELFNNFTNFYSGGFAFSYIY